MFEVGKTYTTVSGEDYKCLCVTDKHAYLVSHECAAAYVWTLDGTSVSLNSQYNITFDPRDQEIADLKTRVAVLTAIVQADEYTIDLNTHIIMRDASETCVHVWRK